jgi:D-sedoheptulose 7-phosphate isomerase
MIMALFDCWRDKTAAMVATLDALVITDRSGSALVPDRAFSTLADLANNLKNKRGTLFLIGNGASASLASHFALDLMKNGLFRTSVLTDPAAMTAWGNDHSYEEVFSAQLAICMKPGDALAAISSSGRSPNILRACQPARAAGATLVTFSAMKEDNPLRSEGDLNFYIPAPTYGLAESGHAVILHHWVDLVCSAQICQR